MFLLIPFTAATASAAGNEVVPQARWETISPEAAGIDATKIAHLFSLSFDDPATQAVVLIKNGRLVGERYADGFNGESVGTSWSMAKSMYAALIGISIDRGEIGNLDDKVADYIDVYKGGREHISIRHLLDMTSGLAFPEHEHEAMFFGRDHLAYALKVGVEKQPGEVFEYNNVNSMVLGEVLHRATGKPADQLLAERIFDKIGIDKYTLWRDAAGNPMTYCCIDMSARDFSRFGLLFARDGEWEEQKIIPSGFVDETFQQVWSDLPSQTINQLRGYGMHWWVSRNNERAVIFNTSGKFGQYIFVDRANDVVFTRITRYRPTGGSVQNWGAMRVFNWIENVSFLQKLGGFLDRIGLIDLGTEVSTPYTLEDGISDQFFSQYRAIVDALVDISD